MRSKLDIFTCDRCKASLEIREPSQSYAWCDVNVREINGPFHIGDDKTNRLICPKCSEIIKSFWAWNIVPSKKECFKISTFDELQQALSTLYAASNGGSDEEISARLQARIILDKCKGA